MVCLSYNQKSLFKQLKQAYVYIYYSYAESGAKVSTI
jgi:hypothetical protein